MKIRFFTLFIFLVPALSYATEWFEGENLLMEVPDTKLFDAYKKNEPGWISTMWQSKSQKGGDSYVVNIVSGKPPKLSKFKASQDKPGKDACGEFSSEVIVDSKRNGYKSIFWETSCKIKGMTIRSIQLAIAGRDSLYHARKLWKIPVTENNYSSWKSTMSSISLCDTRRESNACPKGYKRASNP